MTVPRKIMPHQSNDYGATLVELIITIVIISISLTGILSVVNLTTRHSPDPMLQHQAIAIAESYLEEIMLLPITDPDGSNAGETRSTFDNIADYDGLEDIGAKNQHGNAITGLDSYTVNVNLINPDPTISGVSMKAMTVTVSRSGTDTISLTGYRADY